MHLETFIFDVKKSNKKCLQNNKKRRKINKSIPKFTAKIIFFIK